MSNFEKELIKNGYEEFNVPPFKKYASKFYQKKVRDSDGIPKYCIDCYFYGYNDRYKYEFELYMETGVCCVNTKLYGFTPDNLYLEKIEKQMEEIYQRLGDILYE